MSLQKPIATMECYHHLLLTAAGREGGGKGGRELQITLITIIIGVCVCVCVCVCALNVVGFSQHTSNK